MGIRKVGSDVQVEVIMIWNHCVSQLQYCAALLFISLYKQGNMETFQENMKKREGDAGAIIFNFNIMIFSLNGGGMTMVTAVKKYNLHLFFYIFLNFIFYIFHAYFYL